MAERFACKENMKLGVWSLAILPSLLSQDGGSALAQEADYGNDYFYVLYDDEGNQIDVVDYETYLMENRGKSDDGKKNKKKKKRGGKKKKKKKKGGGKKKKKKKKK